MSAPEETTEQVNPQIFHHQAEAQRENAQTEDSLKSSDVAIQGYKDQGEFEKAAEALLGKSIAQLHLADFIEIERSKYLSQARATVEESQRIIQEHHISSQSLDELLPARFGSLVLEEGNYEDAYAYYKTAYDISVQNKQPLARQGNNLYHVGFIRFKLGEKEEGLMQIDQAIKMIDDQGSDIKSETRRTWKSGAYLRLADCFMDEGKVNDAADALGSATRIIKAEPVLPVRSRQLGRYERRLSQVQPHA